MRVHTDNGIFIVNTLTEQVSEELNGMYEYEATLSAFENGSEVLHARSLITAFNGVSDQIFRVYDIKEDIYGVMTVKAQHISYDLAKIPVKPFGAFGASNILTAIKNNAFISHPFTFETDITNTTSRMDIDKPMMTREILGGTEGSFLDRFHCEYEFDNYVVRALRSRGTRTNVKIEYGFNMTDFERERNSEDFYTAVIGFAIVDNQVYYSSIIRLGEDGSKATALLDFSDKYEEGQTPTLAELNAYANDYISSHNVSEFRNTLSVGYIDLASTDQYRGAVEPVHLGDTVTVVHSKMGVTFEAKAYSYVFNCLTNRYDSIVVGDPKKNLYDFIESASSSDISNPVGANVYYGTSATAQGTVKKETAISFFPTEIPTGCRIYVKFTYANTASNPTLAINGGTAVAIKRYGTTAPGGSAAASWNAGSVVELVYDGTYWQLVGWINTTYGSMTVAEYEAGTSGTARLITPARLKAAILHHATPTAIGEADFIAEQGTTGSWAYRKWNSGKVEAWRTLSVTASATTQVDNMHRSTFTVDLPSGLFNTTPHTIAQMDAGGTNIVSVYAHATSTTEISGRVWRANANANVYNVETSFYCWKG